MEADFGMVDKESSTCARRLFRASGYETEKPFFQKRN
jgi:hypothetical protein